MPEIISLCYSAILLGLKYLLPDNNWLNKTIMRGQFKYMTIKNNTSEEWARLSELYSNYGL